MKSILKDILSLDSDTALITLLVAIWIIVMIFVVFYSDSPKKPLIQSPKSKTEVKPYSYYKYVLSRKVYYRTIYLKSDAWRRKRYVVLKRDNWCCVHCGSKATQVHHKRYAYNIGKEPIKWLESVCKTCHDRIHK